MAEDRTAVMGWEPIPLSICGETLPCAIQFFKQFHAENDILARSKAGLILVIEQDGMIVATGGAAWPRDSGRVRGS
jgi:hypothetical protein